MHYIDLGVRSSKHNIIRSCSILSDMYVTCRSEAVLPQGVYSYNYLYHTVIQAIMYVC